ncbi:hypothetical protein AM493_11265 [Flavobacterium akiainvivens]|uniref:Uncharacterized protein n=2 Tax=Flavobacterium akiainvivens TaxID=1202724 RepID=A0A0N0RQR8_9FLAO|nr:hypothetical protein AM493_11265 [Flavobacterium akiainvivens]
MAAQQRKPLTGIVTVGEARVPGVFIINKKTGDEAKTDSKGSFTIMARDGDLLAVNSPITQDREFYINEDSFKKMPYVLGVEAKATELEEVIINDTVKIIQPVKSNAVYTQGERRVNTGAKVQAHTMDYAGGGIGIGTDALLNGGEKRRALRRELKTEQLNKNIETINFAYSNESITATWGIPAEKVNAFIYYAAEDDTLEKALKANNTEQANLQMSVLAKEYLALQEEEASPPATGKQ